MSVTAGLSVAAGDGGTSVTLKWALRQALLKRKLLSTLSRKIADPLASALVSGRPAFARQAAWVWLFCSQGVHHEPTGHPVPSGCRPWWREPWPRERSTSVKDSFSKTNNNKKEFSRSLETASQQSMCCTRNSLTKAFNPS